MQENAPKIILFDGVCTLCNGFVQFVIKHDTHVVFQFGALQSAAAQELLHKTAPAHNFPETVILIDDGQVFTKSSASLRILKHLRWPISWLYVCVVIPKFLRDAVYVLLAKNRYRLFGKKDSCMLPTAELKSRFI